MADVVATPETPPTPAPQADQQADETKLGDPGKAALDQERKARRDAEKALKEATAKLAEIADKDKTETQRLTERVAAAERAAADATARWQQASKTSAIIAAATAAKAIDADAVAALIADKVTVSDTGEVEGVDAAIKALVGAKPHLFSTTNPGTRDLFAGVGNTPTSKTFDDLLRGR